MKIILCLLWCCVWKSVCHLNLPLMEMDEPSVVKNPYRRVTAKYKEFNFTQQIDHFNHTNINKFNQRYLMNDKFHKKGGPIFLLIGDLRSISHGWLTNGDWIEYAKKFGALCFYLEHRFYGKSRPFPDTSTQNLVYLTSEQALADIAWFIHKMNKVNKEKWTNFQWVTFGGSYAGSLSAWARMKFPHLIHAAVSTSSILVAQPFFEDYYKVVENVLISENKECAREIKRATDRIKLLLQDKNGIKYIEEKFKLCAPINREDPQDIAQLYLSLAINVGIIAKFNNVNQFYANPNQNQITIKNICEVMTNSSMHHAVDRYAKINENMLNFNKVGCIETRYSEIVNFHLPTKWNQFSGNRLWLYQMCTEYGSFPTSEFSSHVFGKFSHGFYYKLCQDVFGISFNESLGNFVTEKSNAWYGELDARQSRVIYIHGSADPLNQLGVTEQRIVNTRAMFINGTAHCANMYPSSSNDTSQLLKTREEVGKTLEEWLRESDTFKKSSTR